MKGRGRDPSAIPLWDTLRARVEEGDHPSKRQLLEVERLEGVPSDMVEYFTDRMSAEPRPGRPKRTREERAARLALIVDLGIDVELRAAAYRLLKIPAPKRQAVEYVATKHYYASDTLADMLKYGLREAPRAQSMVPSRPEANAVVSEGLDRGTFRLDPHAGFVRLPEIAPDPTAEFRRIGGGRPYVARGDGSVKKVPTALVRPEVNSEVGGA